MAMASSFGRVHRRKWDPHTPPPRCPSSEANATFGKRLEDLVRDHLQISENSDAFHRETSPGISDASAEIPHLRASSLVQMWREFEAEARLSSRRVNRTDSMNSTMSTQTNTINTDNGSSVGEQEPFGEERLIDWESDLMTAGEPPSSSRTSTESERGRVADMIKKLTSGNQTQSDSTSWNDELDIREHLPGPPSPVPIRDPSAFTRNVESVGLNEARNLNSTRVRGRQAMRHLLLQIAGERQRELASLGERHVVSRFSHRGRIQSLLRFRFLSRMMAIQDRREPAPTSVELNQLPCRTSILILRERYNRRVHQDSGSVLASDNPGSYELQFSNNSVHSTIHPESSPSSEEPASENSQYQEEMRRNDAAELPESISLPPINTSEELQEETIQSSNVNEWREASVPIDSIDWRENENNPTNLESWERDDVMEEAEPDRAGNVEETWLGNSLHQMGEWDDRRGATYDDWLESNSGNLEIQLLLERRRVSTALASDFRNRMEQLLFSCLERQGLEPTEESMTEEDEEHLNHRQNNDAANAALVAATSTQLPLPSQLLHYYENIREESPFAQQEMEFIYDLRGEMIRLHQEMCDLRESIRSCMNMQVELQHSIKHEVSAVAGHSGMQLPGGKFDSSNWVPARKGNCCVCYEMQVDSLLYRCGHMCTCFNCARELQWSSGRCPICRAPIVDVVKTYSGP